MGVALTVFALMKLLKAFDEIVGFLPHITRVTFTLPSNASDVVSGIVEFFGTLLLPDALQV